MSNENHIDHEQLAFIVENSPVAIVLTDFEGRITYVNRAFENMSGYTRREVIGQNPRILKSGEQSDAFYRKLWETISAGNIWKGAFHNRRKNGHLYWARSSINPITDAEGRIVSYLALNEDITEQKRMETELLETNEKLQQTVDELREREEQLIKQERLHALGRMASGVSHDFNNALQPILLAAAALIDQDDLLADRETARGYLQDILQSAQNAADTVKRLSRFYKPSIRDEALTIDIQQLIHEVVDLTHMKWREQARHQGKHIVVTAEAPEACWIEGIESEIREMLINLIFNAVEAIDQAGEITISGRTESEGWVTLKVTDNGSGMPQDIAQRCLEPFFTTKHERGTGLGLSIVHGIVGRHRGKMEIHTKENEGTTIKMLFPAAHKLVPEAPPETETPPTERAHTGHLLVVDDEALVLTMLSRVLTSLGYRVTTALSGAEGLQYQEEDPSDCVITDQSMPGMTGEEMAAVLKQRNPDLPVIMLTGFGELMKNEKRMPRHIDCLLGKPIQPDELDRAIQSALTRA